MRLNSIFDSLIFSNRKEEVMKLIESVFIDVNERYFSGNESVYEKEDNFIYVLYQSLNGKDDDANLSPIREAAKRLLELYPRAIEYYWRKSEENLEVISLKDLFEIAQKSIVIITDEDLKNNLIEITKEYQNIINGNKEFNVPTIDTSKAKVIEYQQNSAFKPLMRVMIDQGLIKEEISHFKKDNL